MSEKKSPIIVALDFADAESALQLTKRLDPDICRLKVGKELFVAAGPDLVRRLHDEGYDVFLDLKFHDIPQTVAKACKAAASLGVWMLNVHASGGQRMLMAAREAVERSTAASPHLIAVTVLTSAEHEDLASIGINYSPQAWAMRLAALSKDCGLDGVVCSAHEAQGIKAACGPEFITVTPGIRPAGDALGDQRRVMTPQQALAQGAQYLVMGRPITHASDPIIKLRQVLAEIAGVTAANP